jgi:hypothetical protein
MRLRMSRVTNANMRVLIKQLWPNTTESPVLPNLSTRLKLAPLQSPAILRITDYVIRRKIAANSWGAGITAVTVSI